MQPSPLRHAAFALAFLLPAAAIAQEMPALPVSVATPLKREVVNWIEFPGRFEAAASVEVRAQVAGALQSVNFTDGQEVEKGDLLFTIDPRSFEAALRAAEAAVKGGQTRLDLAEADQARATELRTTGNVAEATLQARQQAFLEAQANLDASKAQVETARINLDYTRITAPISGRIGRKLVTEGNLIAAGSSGTLLTTIVAFDPVDFYFDVDENNFLTYQRSRGGNARADGDRTVFLKTTDESEFTREGTLDFLDNTIDASTGTIRVRARLPNEEGTITPGQFGRVLLPLSQPTEATLVPENAIMADQTRHLVMTVDAENKVVPRPVERGALYGNMRVVTGLNGDEQIIVNGLMRARPGSTVVPQKTEIEAPEDLTKPLPAAQ